MCEWSQASDDVYEGLTDMGLEKQPPRAGDDDTQTWIGNYITLELRELVHGEHLEIKFRVRTAIPMGDESYETVQSGREEWIGAEAGAFLYQMKEYLERVLARKRI